MSYTRPMSTGRRNNFRERLFFFSGYRIIVFTINYPHRVELAVSIRIFLTFGHENIS